MSVTIADIKRKFPTADRVQQVGYKQLFIVTKGNNKFLISYRTIVGVWDSATGIWYITTRKYSVTTTKQVNAFFRQPWAAQYQFTAHELDNINIDTFTSFAAQAQ